MANQPERYAATEATERLVLAGLPWTGSLQAAYCLNLSNPIAKVRAEMRRVYGPQMQGLDAKLARLSAYSADESAVRSTDVDAISHAAQAYAAEARAEQQDMIAQKMQSGAYAHDAPRSTTYDPKTGIQRFGIGR